jgi:hypothetical protein
VSHCRIDLCYCTSSRGGRDEKRVLARRAQPVQPGGETLPDRRAGLERSLGKLRAAELCCGQDGRQFGQRQGITAGLGMQSPRYLRGRLHAGDGLNEAFHRIHAEPGQFLTRQAGGRGRAGAHRHKAGDRVAVQAAQPKQERLLARRIQPVQVVDQNQQRTVLRGDR